jgi:hypothetical protein
MFQTLTWQQHNDFPSPDFTQQVYIRLINTEDAQNVTEKQCQYNKRTKTRLIHLHGIPS